MRGVLLACLLAACSPDIAPGAYLCGPEQLCPEGLACNGPDNICVTAAGADPFECGTKFADVPGDDAPATAQSLGELACISLVVQERGCLPPGDTNDFYTFAVAAECASARVQASVVFPIAFQSLGLSLAKAGEPPRMIDTPCSGSRAADEGEAVACLEAPVSAGTYVIGVVPDGTGGCDGACRYNRYGLAVQVTTP